MGVAENPMRLQMEEAARIAGLRYVVNIVSDAKENITGCFVGDPVASHREGGCSPAQSTPSGSRSGPTSSWPTLIRPTTTSGSRPRGTTRAPWPSGGEAR